MSMMRCAVLVAAGWVVVQPAFAAEPKGGKRGGAQPVADRPAADPKRVDATARARILFIQRVDMCAPPQKCTGETSGVVDDAEKQFVAACVACAPEKRCEEDRARIRDGKAQRSFNPCR